MQNKGRWAGLLYILISIPGVFGLVYVPNKVIVTGDATATVTNILAHETLFRTGIAVQLLSQTLFILVALALYDLLKHVNKRHALAMLSLIALAIPIPCLNELNSLAALSLAHGSTFLSAMEKPQRDVLAMLFMQLHARGTDIAGVFWGLWLFPLGSLVYRSRFVPRFLAVWLIIAGVA